MGRSGQELAWLHEAVELGEADDAVWPGAAHEVVRAKLVRMVEARTKAITVSRWKCATRSDLSEMTMARWRSLSCVATPVGQRSVWHCWDWRQPTANMKPRAALHQSAPSAITLAMSKPETILPAAPSLILSRKFTPIRAECTKVRPSRMGMPR